jgi:hypothetical protein
MPGLFEELRQVVADLGTPVPFVLHVGDFVEVAVHGLEQFVQ